MVIFISGSINSGKTTTARALATELDAEHIDIDDLNDRIPDFNLATDIYKGIAIAIDEINALVEKYRSVVVSYVIRNEDRTQIIDGLSEEPFFITLAPRLEIAQSKRGQRELSDWEKTRIQFHYDTGIADPSFGTIIDNSELTVDETVNVIVRSLETS